MATKVEDYVLDNGLVALQTADEVHLCTAQPTSYAEVATYSLGSTGTFTISGPADDGTSGRKVTLSPFSATAVTGSSVTVNHIAIVDASNSRLLAVVELVSGISISTDTDINIVTSTVFVVPDYVAA